MALYIPHKIFHLARLLFVRPETSIKHSKTLFQFGCTYFDQSRLSLRKISKTSPKDGPDWLVRLKTNIILFYYILYYIFYHVPFILINISDDSGTETRGRPLHTKNLMPLADRQFPHFFGLRQGWRKFFKDANPNGGKNIKEKKLFRVWKPEFTGAHICDYSSDVLASRADAWLVRLYSGHIKMYYKSVHTRMMGYCANTHCMAQV
jgi:hypothetical protein